MGRLRIEPEAYLLWALWLLILPLDWGAGALMAASVHELFHILAVLALRTPIHLIRIGGRGACIETGPMNPPAEVLCALAGPAGSFSMLLFSRVFPQAALWGLFQGLYNLLPLYPLDGGRVMRALLPGAVCAGVEAACLTLMAGVSIYAMLGLKLGLAGMLPLMWSIFLCLNRKIPCKEANY